MLLELDHISKIYGDLLDGAPKCPGCGKPLDFEVTEE